ncbi:MAG: hypothetical protein IT204_05145 [Fimbriimonadaceae bacterium]|nr:hypothetical protein [Fimbriimonadaceae bacterium]
MLAVEFTRGAETAVAQLTLAEQRSVEHLVATIAANPAALQPQWRVPQHQDLYVAPAADLRIVLRLSPTAVVVQDVTSRAVYEAYRQPA